MISYEVKSPARKGWGFFFGVTMMKKLKLQARTTLIKQRRKYTCHVRKQNPKLPLEIKRLVTKTSSRD
jgi:hypothetical protein